MRHSGGKELSFKFICSSDASTAPEVSVSSQVIWVVSAYLSPRMHKTLRSRRHRHGVMKVFFRSRVSDRSFELKDVAAVASSTPVLPLSGEAQCTSVDWITNQPCSHCSSWHAYHPTINSMNIRWNPVISPVFLCLFGRQFSCMCLKKYGSMVPQRPHGVSSVSTNTFILRVQAVAHFQTNTISSSWFKSSNKSPWFVKKNRHFCWPTVLRDQLPPAIFSSFQRPWAMRSFKRWRFT